MAIFPPRHDPNCPACGGGVCKGGGNPRCTKRDPRPSRIGLILDTYGGIRTIVAPMKSMRANVRHDEWLFVVPNLRVHEPIAWDDIPWVVARSEAEFDLWLDTLPNLEEDHDLAVRLYKLHKLRHRGSRESMHLPDFVET